MVEKSALVLILTTGEVPKEFIDLIFPQTIPVINEFSNVFLKILQTSYSMRDFQHAIDLVMGASLSNLS